ncbi:MAG: hypothetical protein IPP13_03200 [Kouleothrix sp.]|nr:hypothetical protein [Kouleothrix sp.]
MDHTQHELYPHYQQLWQHAWPRVRHGPVEYDPHLATKATDGRRGLTIVARLASSVTEQLSAMQHQLSALEPYQYAYPPADMHLTILSLFTTTLAFQPYLERLAAYREAIAPVVWSTPVFGLETIGITLSPSAVLAQGFPHDGTLNHTRDRLRAALLGCGLGDSLDQRYRLVSAHTTLLRFATPFHAPEVFAHTLAAYRHTNFGSSLITSFDLVINDWYMSAEKVRIVDTYQLVDQEPTEKGTWPNMRMQHRPAGVGPIL